MHTSAPLDLKNRITGEEPLRPAWIIGTFVAIALTGLFSWTGHRDELARRLDPADQRLAQLVRATHCAPPESPLEVMVMSIGSQADGQRPEIQCVYLTAPMGQRLEQRRAPPVIFAQARR